MCSLPVDLRARGTGHFIFIVKSCEQAQSERVSRPEHSFFCSITMAGDKSQEVIGREQAPHFKLPVKAVAGWSLPSWFY